MEIRKAEISDIPLMSRIIVSNMKPIFGSDEAEIQNSLLIMIENRLCVIFVAFDGQNIAGVMSGGLVPNSYKKGSIVAQSGTVCIVKKYSKGNVEDFLFKAFEDWAAESEVAFISFSINNQKIERKLKSSGYSKVSTLFTKSMEAE